ncbi:hypothetical protein [Kribbella capetownensis]|nr:hypothetical protein [Kribbella capetownensis]
MAISEETCRCGRAVDEHDRHVRFELPTPIRDLPEREPEYDGVLS